MEKPKTVRQQAYDLLDQTDLHGKLKQLRTMQTLPKPFRPRPVVVTLQVT